MHYRTSEGDMLDWVCWKHYGRQSGVVEQVLEANVGLADYGEVLPAGLIVELPDIPVIKSKTITRLWD